MMNFEPVSPESLGIASQGIEAILDKFDKIGLTMHSILLLRHDKVAAECYYKPFDKDFKHRMYSVSKSFASAAIGALIGEGKLSLTDPVYRFFPDKCPEELHPYIKETTVRDLLMMATPFDIDTYSMCDLEDCGCTYTEYGRPEYKDWARTFFHAKPSHPSGTVFHYNTSASYILAVLAERLSGKSMMEYLYEKALCHLGFSPDAWCVKAPEGNSWAGSGVMCTTRDLARFATLLMHDGMGYLPADYVKAATTKQIDNFDGHLQGRLYGYGYQIWCMRDNSFVLNGMGCQFAFCIPSKDLIFVCTADNQGAEIAFHTIYEALWDNVVNKLSDEPLPPNAEAEASLRRRAENLTLTTIPGEAHSAAYEAKHNRVRFSLNENPMQIKWFQLEFKEDCGIFRYENARGVKEICFGYGTYQEGVFPETHYSGDTIGVPKGTGYRCAACGAWPEEHKLNIKVNIIDDYFGNLMITVAFKGEEATVYMRKTAEWFLDEYQGFAGGKKEA